MSKIIDTTMLNYFYTKLKGVFVTTESGKGLSTNDFTKAYKDKLDGIDSGANKTVVDTALSSTSTNPVQNKVINTALANKADTNTASTTVNGLMSATDKAKLDGIAEGANKYTHPTYTSRASGLYKITVDATGHVSNVANVAKTDITALGIPSSDTTYSVATQSANGLMSSTDKTKLDGIETGANKTTVDTALSSTSTNPVTNKAITQKLNEITSVGGEPNVIETVKVNGAALTPDASKAVDVSVPTKVSELTNDSGYQTATQVNTTITGKGYQTSSQVKTIVESYNYATKSDISTVFSYKGSVESYSDLPTTGQNVGDTYNIETADSTHGIKAGDNVTWNGEEWDVLGGTVDLSGYWDKTTYTIAATTDIDAIFG